MNTWHRGDDANWRIESIVHYDVTNYKTEDFHTTIDTGYPDETATVKPTIITYDLRITTNQKVKATEKSMVLLKLTILLSIVILSCFGCFKNSDKTIKFIFFLFQLYGLVCVANFFHFSNLSLICLLSRIVIYLVVAFFMLLRFEKENYFSIVVLLYLVIHYYFHYFGIDLLKFMVLIPFLIMAFYSKEKLLFTVIIIDMINKLI